MERKIGEIFEYNGGWYQCVVAIQGCRECSFRTHDYCTRHLECLSDTRNDKTSVIFKKLEKVGEPTILMGKMVQEFKNNNDNHCEYCCFNKDCHPLEIASICDLHNSFFIEIKQTKEDMGDNDNIRPYDELFSPGTVNNTKCLTKENIEEKKLNLKPFDIQKAKAGKPVCTRDGRKARIICFDRDCDMHIVALVSGPLGELVHYYLSNGKVDSDKQNDEDLMMLPENKEGWVIMETSIKNDRKDNKIMMELLPWPELEEIAKVYTAGAKKYGPNKWQNLPDGYQRYKGAMLRHLTEHEKGNLIDSETGCYHIAQCAWNTIAMLHFVLEEIKRIENEKGNQSE